jgi:hypothetical protein
MVWRIGRPAEATFALGPPAPEFWVVAITLSFLISGSYGRVTGRDILDGYGLTDILWLWVVSIMLGAVAVYPTIGLLRLFDKLRRGIIQWWTNQTQPTPNDTALKMLKKLDRQGLGTYVEQVTWTDGDQKRTCYLLEPWRPGHATHWVGPEMIIEWNNAPAERQNQIRQAAEQGQPAELAQLLRQGQQARFLTFDWRRDRIPDRPTSIATTALERVVEQPIISGL